MRILLFLVFLFFFLDSTGQVKVRGYYRKNGTYVQPHYRSSPDGNPYNNWSYPGNVNPYTGRIAPGDPATYLNNYYNRHNTYTTPKYNSTATYSPNYTTPDYSSKSRTSPTIYHITSPRLNIRTGPSTFYSILTTLNYNDNVTLINANDYPWYKIKISYFDKESNTYETTYGYAHASFLAPSSTGVDTNYDNIDFDNEEWLNNHSGTKTNLSQTEIDRILNELKTKSDFVSDFSNEDKYYVKSPRLHLRAGPSNTYEVLKTLNYMDKVKIISTTDYPWYQVAVSFYDNTLQTYNSIYGYVHSTYIVPTDAIAKVNTLISNSSSIQHTLFGRGNGKISIWTDCNNEGFISVFIDDVYIGLLVSFYPDTPSCDSNELLSAVKPAGKYKITAVGATRRWEQTIIIRENECVLSKIHR